MAFDDLRSKPLPPPPPPLVGSWPPFGSSDDTMDVVVIELSEPCDEGDNAANFSFSLSVFLESINGRNMDYIEPTL